MANITNIPLNNLQYHIVDGSALWIVGVADEFKNTKNNHLNLNDASFAPYGAIYIGQDAFKGISQLEKVTITDKVRIIKTNAFADCTNLIEFILPSTQDIQIDFGILTGCAKLTTLKGITFTETASYLGYFFGYYSYLDNYKITSNLHTVEANNLTPFCLHGCEYIQTVTLANSVTVIPQGAFYNCKALTWLAKSGSSYTEKAGILVANFEVLEEEAFFGCLGFDTLLIPEQYITIRAHVFKNCFNLVRIINNTIGTTGELEIVIGGSYYGDAGLYALTILKETDYTKINPLGEILELDDYKYLIKMPANGKIPETITHINNYIGQGLTTLTSISIPNTVCSIGAFAFSNCPNLEELIINDYQHKNYKLHLAQNVFSNCTQLKKIRYKGDLQSWMRMTFDYPQSFFKHTETFITEDNMLDAGILTLPNDLDKISANSFSNASFIKELKFTFKQTATTLTEIDEYAFYNCTNLNKIYYIDASGQSHEGFPETISLIRDYAFTGCTSLNFVTEGGIKYLGAWIFGVVNNKITDCNIKRSHKYIVSNAFKDCDQLFNINYEGTLAEWLDINFSNLYSNPAYSSVPQSADAFVAKNIKFNQISLSEINTTITLSSIKPFAFCGLKIPKLIFNGNAADIGQDAFKNSFITEITCQPSCTQFLNTTGLTILNLVAGSDASQIPAGAFYNNKTIHTINFITLPTYIGFNAFYGCNNLSFVGLNDGTSLSAGRREMTPDNVNRLINLWASVTFANKYANPLCYNAVLCDYHNPRFYYTDLETIYFEGTAFYAFSFLNFKKLKNIIIGNHIQAVDQTCFAGCKLLNTFTDLVGNSKYNFISTTQLIEDIPQVGAGIVENNILLFGTPFIDLTNDAFTTVTTIAEHAFYESAIESITIPTHITKIGFGAFEGCSNLANISLPFTGTKRDPLNSAPNTNHIGYIFGAFSPQESILYVPKVNTFTVHLTGDYIHLLDTTFMGCEILSHLYISGTVRTFASDCLDPCTRLNYVKLAPTIEEQFSCLGISKSELDNTPVIIKSCTNQSGLTNLDVNLGNTRFIYKDAFKNSAVTSITCGDHLVSIGPRAFKGCTQLAKFNFNIGSNTNCIKASIIEREAFSGCCKLGSGTNVKLEIVSNKIDYYAFYNCTGISTIILADTLTKDRVKLNAFTGCINLINATISTELCKHLPRNSIETIIFNAGNVIENSALSNCVKLASIDILSGSGVTITQIGSRAFYGCISLYSLPWENIQENCTIIGTEAFFNCRSLYEIYIPNQIEQDYDTQGVIKTVYKTANTFRFTASVAGEYKFLSSDIHVRFLRTATTGWYASNICELEKDQTVYINFWFDKESIDNPAKTTFDLTFIGPTGCNSITLTKVSGTISTLTLTNAVFGADFDAAIKSSISRSSLNSAELISTQSVKSLDYLPFFGIGTNAFSGCFKLVEAVFSDDVDDISVALAGGAQNYIKYRRRRSEDSCISISNNFVFYTLNTDQVLLAYLDNNPEVTLPTGTYAISNSAFINNDIITKIDCDSSNTIITNLGTHAFYSCGKLEEVLLGKVNLIETEAFSNCPKLTNIQICGMCNLAHNSFIDCTDLNKITFNADSSHSLTTNISIESNPFYKCPALQLEILDLPERFKLINNKYFIEVLNSETKSVRLLAALNQDFNYTPLNTGSILGSPYKISELNNNAFQNIKNITTCTIANTITVIGALAFANTGITELIFDSGSEPIMQINLKAFANCNFTNHTSNTINIQRPINFIGSLAFADSASSIRSITLPNGTNTDNWANNWNYHSSTDSSEIEIIGV